MNDLMQTVQLIEQGRLAEAEAQCRRVLAGAPQHPGARFLLGMCAAQRGAFDEALAIFEEVVVIAPGFTDAQDRLGQLYLRAGRVEDAIARFEEVARQAPGLAAVHAQLGAARLRADRFAAAADAFRKAVRIDPASASLHKRLGDALWLGGRTAESSPHHLDAIDRWTGKVDAGFFEHVWRQASTNGKTGAARRVAEKWIALDPASAVAPHCLAASGGAAAPARASDGYVEATFDAFASSFDEQLATIGYRGPEHVARALAAARPAPAGHALDAGCGTGLCGPLVRPSARVLVGVDLSSKMLEKARDRGCYDDLVHAELTAYLESQPGRFDFVVCADTFIYFGDLAPLARAFAFALAPGGHLVFSAEERPAQPGRAPGYDLLPSGRYHHDRAYAEAVSRDAGLEVAAVEAITVRTENGVPLPGFVMTVVRPA